MKIKVSNGLIMSYAIVGNIDNSVEISDDIVPYDFLLNFKPKKYKYEGGQIVLNENYSSGNNEQPIQPPNISMPGSDEELRRMFASMQIQIVQGNVMVSELSQQNARLAQDIISVSTELEKLKGDN